MAKLSQREIEEYCTVDEDPMQDLSVHRRHVENEASDVEIKEYIRKRDGHRDKEMDGAMEDVWADDAAAYNQALSSPRDEEWEDIAWWEI